MWWLWLIIGVLTWQVISTITFIATKEDEDKTALVGCGVVILALWCIVTASRRIAQKIKIRRSEQEHTFDL